MNNRFRLFLDRLPTEAPGNLRRVTLRAFQFLVALLIFVAGWLFIAAEHRLLWLRLPPESVDRFVADQIKAPITAPLPVAEVLGVCAEAPGTSVWRTRSDIRDRVAHCLADPAASKTGAAAAALATELQGAVKRQLTQAAAWLAEHDAQATEIRRRLRQDLAAARAEQGGPGPGDFGLRIAEVSGSPAAQSVREAVGHREPPDRSAQTIRDRIQSTQARLDAIQASGGTDIDRVRALALLATGQQLQTDYGKNPPKPQLVTDRTSLADALEWQRRAQSYASNGFSLSRLHDVPVGLAVGAALLWLMVLAARVRWSALAAWTLVAWLLGLSSVLLTDIALTGDPALRYLAERQFVGMAVAGRWLPLLIDLPLGGRSLPLWWPLPAAGLIVACVGAIRDGRSRVLAPLNAWLRWGSSGRLAMLQLMLLFIVGVGTFFLLKGMSALCSELLIFLGVLGLATFLARQAALTNSGGSVEYSNLWVVVAAVAIAAGGSRQRGDLGHMLVALVLAACFAWLFARRWLSWLLVIALAGGLGLHLASLLSGRWVGPMAILVDVLPDHARERMAAMFDPFHVATSDLARTQWLMASAGGTGWGAGYSPWQGLAPGARAHEGLPLQGPSDYVLALTTSIWGQSAGVAVLGLGLLLFAFATWVGLRRALQPGASNAARFFAALGGFGCLVMAVKVVLSVGGVSRVLPLTGLPVALIGYGPVTHAFALLYLACALGSAALAAPLWSRGVFLHRQKPFQGVLRSRFAGATVPVLGFLMLLLFGAAVHGWSTGDDQVQRHVARDRLDLAQSLARSLVAADDTLPPAAAAPLCPELESAAAAWNLKLAQRLSPAGAASGTNPAPTLKLDLERLRQEHPVASDQACKALAGAVGNMLVSDFGRLVGSENAGSRAAADAGTLRSRLLTFQKPRGIAARPLDYTTANPWWGLPGCASTLSDSVAGQASSCGAAGEGASSSVRQVATDVWLQRELAPQIELVLRQPAGAMATINHRQVKVGPSLSLTLSPQHQQRAQMIADCFSGRLSLVDCDAYWPRDSHWRSSYGAAGKSLRAGAVGLVLAEIDSGRIVAMAGSISDCTLDHLGRVAASDAQGRVSALLGSRPCAQLPDRRSAFLALQHPALWQVPPGSSIKPLAMAAGIDAGLIPAADDAHWRAILAESVDRKGPQRIAVAAGQRYFDALHGVGFDSGPLDLMWGGIDRGTSRSAHWLTDSRYGTALLRPTTMSFDDAEVLRAEKQSGKHIGRLHGVAVEREFMATRALADAALGGGDIRLNAVGLVDIWRRLDLRSRGRSQAPSLHLIEQNGRAIADQPIALASPAAAARAIGMTTGITASALKGTAQGSCRVVFGACPAQGLPGLAGKTGSSDFLIKEDGAWVKAGLQLPAKVFGGVFSAADGKRYAVAAMALRVREGQTQTLELHPSAPAEAALMLVREMRENP